MSERFQKVFESTKTPTTSADEDEIAEDADVARVPSRMSVEATLTQLRALRAKAEGVGACDDRRSSLAVRASTK